MPRAKAAPRVKGPYAERGGRRFRIRICEATGQRDVYFSTLAEARAGMQQAERALPAQAQMQTRELLALYTRALIDRGTCLASSATHQQVRIAAFLQGQIDEDVSLITVRRASALYARHVSTPTKKTGKPPAASTQRFDLRLVQAFFRWLLAQKYLRESPFAAVTPVGRASRGKKQLRFEEAAKFISAGLALFDTRDDMLALASVTVLLLGCRAGELLHVRVRDLDCGGTRLWLAAQDGGYAGKTRNAVRNADVPTVIQSRLHALTAGRSPDDYLFGRRQHSKPVVRQLLWTAVRRVCVAAAVPIVCVHSLRGLWATAGVRSGALSQAVAAALGHGSFTMTERHYVEPGTLERTRTEQLVKMLEPQRPSDPATLSAEHLLSILPAQTLARLLHLSQTTR